MTPEQNLTQALYKKLHKHEKLVWWARKPPASDPSWDDFGELTKTSTLNECSRIEELYPDETSGFTDFDHGFNSGVLAALRWILTAEDSCIEVADKQFPDLDT